MAILTLEMPVLIHAVPGCVFKVIRAVISSLYHPEA